MTEVERVFVFGASGHAKVVIDIIEKEGKFRIECLADDDPSLKGKSVFGYDVVGGKEELLDRLGTGGAGAGVVAIGSNAARAMVAAWLVANGFRLISAVHPSAQLARGVSVGAGTVIMAGAVINPDTVVGDNVIVNTRASIDHDCVIGDGVHIAPGATLCGTVHVGAGAFVCGGATVIPNLSVGAGAVVGAGSVVIRNVPDAVTVVGSPAQIVRGHV